MKMIDIKTKIDLIFSFNLKLIICRLWSHDPQRSNSTIDQHLLRDDQHPLVDIPGVQPGLSHYSLAQYPHQHGHRQRLKTDFWKEFTHNKTQQQFIIIYHELSHNHPPPIKPFHKL